MEDCLKRLLTDKKEEKRSGGLDLLLRLSKREEKAAFFARETACGFGFYNPNAKEEVKLPAPRTYKDNTFDTNLIVRKPLFIGVFLYSNSIF